MELDRLYHFALLAQFAFAAITFFSLLFITAPYGRFGRLGWGPSVKALYGWIIMETPAVAMIFLWFITSNYNLVSIVMIVIWQSHYLRRSYHYPFTMKGRNKPFPIMLVVFAIIFNCMNGFVNGYHVFHMRSFDVEWLRSWQFIGGVFLFYTGYTINVQSDNILSKLKRGGDGSYVIPFGGMFRYVSSPHYLGEIIEWIGWALLTWSWAGLAFAVYTIANLAPRALSHHKWYRDNFPDYPSQRKALVPFVW
ncbi:MAG: methyltransferase [Bacteroidetes bacterium]|nr:methyltransferase [Bacteroidota bacterium]MDA1121285.1 methyltransferase [Bacteroidota bacterium]